MHTFFYFCVMFFITFEAIVCIYANKIYKAFKVNIDDFDKETQKGDILKYGLFFLAFQLIQIFYWIVNVIGILFSHFRLWFAIIFAMALIKMAVSRCLKKIDNKVLIQRIDSLITVLILSYIIYLKYF